jgi:anti-sigma factor RsiW
MSCQRIQETLDGYLDGELDLVRNMEVEEHLRGCPACTETYQNRLGLRSAVRAAAPYFRAPTELEKRVRSAVRQVAKAAPGPRTMSWGWLGAAAAAAMVLVLAWTLVPRLRGPAGEDLLAREVVSSHVRSLMAAHLTDVASSDQHRVKPWFNGKLDFSPPVKELASEGFPLVGGRLDYLAGRPVAALVYQRRQHFINVFLWPATQGGDTAGKTQARQGYNLIRWTKASMTCWVVSDLSPAELQEFARLLQSRL